MTRSEPAELTLTVRNTYTGAEDPDTTLTVFNGHGARVGQGSGPLRLNVPPGIYTVRPNRMGQLGPDEVILHRAADTHTIPAPRRHSAMPTTDTAHTHEFLQGVSQYYSTASTWESPLEDDPDQSRLMILLRDTGDYGRESYSPVAGVALFAENGALVTEFDPAMTRASDFEGWTVFSARMAPGHYMLCYATRAGSEILPLMVRADWDTHVFVPVERGAPRLSATSMDLGRKGEGFDTNDTRTQRVDAALQGLGMHLDLMPDDLAMEALHGKFRHPLIGLIGAYAHFLSDRRKERLEANVQRNLWSLLEGSADAIAVVLLASERGPDGLPADLIALEALGQDVLGTSLFAHLPIRFPPLFRCGLDVMVRASAQIPELIAPGSWMEAAATGALADGAWSVWTQAGRPEQVKVKPEQGPSTQKIYATIRRALAQAARSGSRRIVARDNVRDILGGLASGPAITRTVRRELRDFDLEALPDLDPAAHGPTVRDLVRQIEATAAPPPLTDLRLSPDTNLPGWLLDLVAARLASEGADFSAARIARETGLPSSAVERAVARLDAGEARP